MDSEQPEDMEAGKSEARRRKEESGKEDWTLTYKPFALGLVIMEMPFLLASIWAASFGDKPQADWVFLPMFLIQGMVTVSLCLSLFALLSTSMTNARRCLLVYLSLVLLMISIILSIISSVMYNRTSHNQGH